MKNDSTKVISFSTQVKHLFLLNGVAWILAGFFQLLQYKVFTVLSIICLLWAIYLKATDLGKSKQKADDMAVANMNSAMAKTLMVGEIIILLFLLIVGDVMVAFMGMGVEISRYISPGLLMFIGLLDFLVGFFLGRRKNKSRY